MKLPFSRPGATEPAEVSEPAEVTESAEASEPTNKKRRFRHVRGLFAPLGRVLAKIPHPPWRSKRGVFVLFLLIAGFGSVVTFGGTTAIAFSETPAFCGMCHTMDPELKAYAMSPHKEVTCAECHINPGLGGFVKAKANGTKQLLHIITGKYPTPIEPPDHADLPPVKVTCLECHEKEKLTENGGPVKLVLRPRYKSDEVNTRETLAILLRPAGLGEGSGSTGAADAPVEEGVKGVHWHVDQEVTYTSGDEHAKKMDLVEYKAKDGTTKQYIAGQQVAVSTDVNPDIERLKSSQKTKTMDCIDCHNRVGHGVTSPDRAVDEAMASGKISAALPFIKRDSVALLNGNYPTLAAADKAIGNLRSTYAQKYPLVLKKNEAKVTKAIDELKVQYRLIATPAMKVQAKTYPDNLGHQTSLGCFRCHDNAHFLVVKGKITNKKIPSECSTCHTFPSIGEMPVKAAPADQPAASAMPSQFAEFPLGAKPVNHKDKLYTFNHKNAVKSTEPAGTTCAACHTKSYCANCHNSGAIKVKHDSMLYNHADSIKASGGTQSCAYCHLPVYCEACHKGPVLDVTAPPAILKGTKAP
jgi:nitrate/TMAO reductase-like tetraheme cytochrome c subunit